MRADVLIVGGGGGAYPAAFALAEAGRHVVMVDPKGVLGGNCLFEGCIPSKTVREMGHLLVRAQRLLGSTTRADFGAIQAHRDHVQEMRFEMHRKELLDHPNVTFFPGTARLRGNGRATVRMEDGEREVEADSTILATGTEAVRPPIPGQELCWTSDDLFRYRTPIRELPEDVVIVGGGYIALEIACILRSLGSRVRLLVRSHVLLRGADPDLVALLQHSLPGLDILWNSTLARVDRDGGSLVVRGLRGTKPYEERTDACLLAVGRTPVLPDGARETGLSVDPRGFVVTDEFLRTNIPGVYATGDVNGRAPYFHAAVRESLAAAHNILAGHRPVDPVNFAAIPVTIFTDPPMAWVGLTRTQAHQRSVEVTEASYPFSTDPKAQMYRETDGEIRLFFDRGSRRLRGGWVLGIQAPELINEIGLAVSAGLTARELAEFPDQHPTSHEGISKAARQIV